jgi:hypothetical protein
MRRSFSLDHLLDAGRRYPSRSLRLAGPRGGWPTSTWATKTVDYPLVGSPCSAHAMVPPFRLQTLW